MILLLVRKKTGAMVVGPASYFLSSLSVHFDKQKLTHIATNQYTIYYIASTSIR